MAMLGRYDSDTPPVPVSGGDTELRVNVRGEAIVELAASSAALGTVAISQATPGTTDSVTVATGQGAGAAIGATSGAKVITDAAGTIQQYLRGLVHLAITGLIAVGNAAAGAADSGNPVKVGGKYNATPPILTDGNRGDAQLDINGNLKVSPVSSLSFATITTQTTTTVKSGAGHIARLVIPTPVANATVKIYDNTAASGTVILDTITFPAALLSSGPVSVELGASFSTGLTIITAGATMSLSVYYA